MLIVDIQKPTVCDECPMLYDGIMCAATGTEVYPNRQARVLKSGRTFDPCENRLDDCPIKGEIVPCDECVHKALADAGCCIYDRNVCVSGKRKEQE